MIPKRFVTKRLRNKKVKFFILNKLKLSNAKVENVVKEPKNPITRKNLKTSFNRNLFCNKLFDDVQYESRDALVPQSKTILG